MRVYLIGELVDLEGDGAEGAVGGLDPGVPLALDEAALEAHRVLGHHQLGLVLDAARVQVLRVAPLPALVRHQLLRRPQPRPSLQHLLQITCITQSTTPTQLIAAANCSVLLLCWSCFVVLDFQCHLGTRWVCHCRMVKTME